MSIPPRWWMAAGLRVAAPFRLLPRRRMSLESILGLDYCVHRVALFVTGVFVVGVVLNIENAKPDVASIKDLIDLTAADMGRVNELILSKAGSDVEMIPQIANHLISSGGKRLRPMLTLAAAQMFGYRGDGHVKLATSVEFMHTATLLHDDVVDESGMRRGKKTARMIWGNQASVLVGDYLLGQAFRMMVEVGSLEALDILSSAASIIAEGEVMQLAAAKNLETTEDEHFAVIKAKTAALFSAAAEVGPVVAGASRIDRAALRSYGMNLGLAFQLIDDALDYGGSSTDLGKNVGDDFREGKVTLPVILAYRRGTAAERAFWKRAIEEGRADDTGLEKATGLLARHGAVADTISRARHFGEIARDALAPLDATPQKSALIDVIDFCISRVS
jgi:octaprenyl-diphosphate synthase